MLLANCGRLRAHACRLHQLARLRHLRQPEIENLGVATPRYKNVCRLNIAVDDASRMGGVERVGNLNRQTK